MRSNVIRGVLDVHYTLGLSAEFFELLEIVTSSNERELLGIAAMYLHALGCDRIFVVDKGGGDSGVDVLGRFSVAPLGGHLLVAVQCKANAGPLTRGAIEAIHTRFKWGLEEDRWLDYQSAMGASELTLSPGLVFMVLGSKGLNREAARLACRVGLLSCSPKQIAHLLSDRWEPATVQALLDRVPSSRDLSRNLVLDCEDVLSDCLRDSNPSRE